MTKISSIIKKPEEQEQKKSNKKLQEQKPQEKKLQESNKRLEDLRKGELVRLESQADKTEPIYPILGALVVFDILLMIMLLFFHISDDLRLWIIGGSMAGTLSLSYTLVKRFYDDHSISIYFESRGYLNAIHLYNFYSKTILFVVPFLLTIISLYILDRIFEAGRNIPFPKLLGISIDVVILIILLTYLHVGFVILLPSLISKDFKLHFAKGYIEMSRRSAGIRKLKYLILGIDSYNEYIQKNLRVRFKDVNKIYSKILCDPTINKDYIINSLVTSLKNQESQTFDSETISYLSTLSDEHHNQFLAKQTLIERIRTESVFLVPVITIVITILGWFVKP